MDSMVIFVLVNVVLAFVVGVMGNIATPKILSFFKRSSLSKRESRIESLASLYMDAKYLKENPNVLRDYCQRVLSQGLMHLTITIFTTSINIFLMIRNPNSSLFLAFLSSFVWGSNAYLSFLLLFLISKRMLEFDTFKDDTFNKLKKLGVNPKELDNIAILKAGQKSPFTKKKVGK